MSRPTVYARASTSRADRAAAASREQRQRTEDRRDAHRYGVSFRIGYGESFSSV